MNKQRREELETAIVKLNEARDIVDSARSDEEYCMDSMPENLEASDRHQQMEDAVSALESAVEDIESAIDQIEEARV